jgi:hypothetical protein
MAHIATRRDSGAWTVDHASSVVTLLSPEEQEFDGRTLGEALAWCLVWLMAPVLWRCAYPGREWFLCGALPTSAAMCETAIQPRPWLRSLSRTGARSAAVVVTPSVAALPCLLRADLTLPCRAVCGHGGQSAVPRPRHGRTVMVPG